jgi:hypothetical protein
MSKVPISIETLLQKQKEERDAASKVCWAFFAVPKLLY